MPPQKGGESAVAQCLGHLLRAEQCPLLLASLLQDPQVSHCMVQLRATLLHRSLDQSAALKSVMKALRGHSQA